MKAKIAILILLGIVVGSALLSMWATSKAATIAEKAPELLRSLKPWNPDIGTTLIGGAGATIPPKFHLNRESRDALIQMYKSRQESVLKQREKEYQLLEKMADKTSNQYENALSLMKNTSLAFADIFKISRGALISLITTTIVTKDRT